MNEKIIESFLAVIAELKNIIDEDIMTSVTDTEKFLGYFPGNKMRMELEIGTPIPEKDPLRLTIKQNKVVSAIVPKEVYGFPFKAVTYPIRNGEGEVIGAVGYAKSLEKEFEVDSITNKVFTSLDETNTALQEVAIDSQNLAKLVDDINENTKILMLKLEEIDKINLMIKNISSKSNLLGLNASIEASRAGNFGKGFAVVAEEMRKLALVSSDSAESVANTLKQMRDNIEKITEMVESTNNIAVNQAAATEELTASVEEITKNTEKLSEITKIDQ